MPTDISPDWSRLAQQDLLEREAAASPTSMSDWLAGREPSHLSTNSGTPLVAFQAWRNFKEAFAPELIGQAFEETSKALGRKIALSIDPFGGSGTTALASQFLNVRPTTIEVNPYLADLIEAKLATYDADQLLRDYLNLLKLVEDVEGDCFPGSPETFVEPGKAGRYIFSAAVAARLGGLQRAILTVQDEGHRRLFRVLLCSIAVELSNVVVSGKGRRYRRGWESKQSSQRDVLKSFDSAFVRAIYDIRRYRNRACLDYTLLRGDSRKLTPDDGAFDVAVFSPPYPNSFDYTDVYNVELWVGAYLTGRTSNTELRKQTLRSHVQIKRSFEVSDLKSPTLVRVSEQLEPVRAALWNASIPDMVKAYFDDMNVILAKLAGSLTEGGRAYMVVGDSRYQGVQVPVADILVELAGELGFEKVGGEPFRSMRASPQQGGKPELLETLVTLKRG